TQQLVGDAWIIDGPGVSSYAGGAQGLDGGLVDHEIVECRHTDTSPAHSGQANGEDEEPHNPNHHAQERRWEQPGMAQTRTVRETGAQRRNAALETSQAASMLAGDENVRDQPTTL